MLDLGDDAAAGLGTWRRVRSGLLLVGVAPVGHRRVVCGAHRLVALVSPQIARRLVRGSGAALLPSAAVGAALLAASDLVARRGSPPPSCQWASHRGARRALPALAAGPGQPHGGHG